MFGIILVGGLALVLAVTLGALVAPAARAATADAYSPSWQFFGLPAPVPCGS